LDDRKEKIASEFKSIDDAKLEISKLKTDYEARISNIEETAKVKIEQAVENGRKITEEVREKAHEEAQGIINSAKKDIKYELEKAKEELKDKIIDLTISATEMVIQEKLTGEGDKKIVKDFLEKVDELK
jgi:F-type H+-transporting ATPase subunit b